MRCGRDEQASRPLQKEKAARVAPLGLSVQFDVSASGSDQFDVGVRPISSLMSAGRGAPRV